MYSLQAGKNQNLWLLKNYLIKDCAANVCLL
jgi:hypothetical protein